MQTTIKEYPVATIGKRILTNVANWGLIISLGILINFFVLYFPLDWDAINSNFKPYNHILFSGLFTVCVVFNSLLWFISMVVIPYKHDGKTFGSLFTKCKLVCEKDKNKFKAMLDHQSIAVVPILAVMLLSALISFAFDDSAQFISSIFGFKPGEVKGTGEQSASTVLFVLFLFACLTTAGNVINVLMNKNTSALLDNQFNVYLIYYGPQEEPKQKKKKQKHDLPGKIDVEELEKL